MIARGEEPFSRIMSMAETTAPGAAFVIISPFIPAPLIEKLGSEGFSARPEHRGDGAWQTIFTRDSDSSVK